MEEPLVNKEYILEKFPGKGGWTYALIPEIQPDKKAWFGWVKVRGSIDGVPIENYNLMPSGSGQLFLAVKADIRKKIGKDAGDKVRIILFAQQARNNVREDLMLCLKEEPAARKQYMSLTDTEKDEILIWISAAKTEDDKVARIAKTIDILLLKHQVNVDS